MSAMPIFAFGSALTPEDQRKLEARWIPAELAAAAGIRRVDSLTGREMFGRRGDLAGLLIPNVFPGEHHPREYRLRLDNPEIEYSTDGSVHERSKYIQPCGRGNLIYFPPGMPTAMLLDTTVPLLITEGEFKALSLWRAAGHQTSAWRFGVVATTGVWNWRGTVGKVGGQNGERLNIKGVIPDIERIAWKGRNVIIAFDADVRKNSSVRAARWKLTMALMDRGAIVGNLEWAAEEGKGIDDRLAAVARTVFWPI
jgi:hypothetical protein